jgi:hypothetical protein
VVGNGASGLFEFAATPTQRTGSLTDKHDIITGVPAPAAQGRTAR